MYRIQLQEFEGPLDLLLFFIRRDELDIYDIPVAQIADEFLEYVRHIERVDLDGVGDFIYMAALLIRIKAKMLLPVQETDEEGEPVDPRRELVDRLLEYVRFKEGAQQLSEYHERRTEHFTRGLASGEARQFLDEMDVRLDVSVSDLVTALRRVLTRASEEPVHEVRRFEYTVEDQQEYVLAQLAIKPKHSFASLVKGRSKPFIITTFLAVLELARAERIWLLTESTRILDFYVSRREPSGKVEQKKEWLSNGAAA